MVIGIGFSKKIMETIFLSGKASENRIRQQRPEGRNHVEEVSEYLHTPQFSRKMELVLT
jgi:hypothetical protein